MSLNDKHLYLRAFFDAYKALIEREGRFILPNARKELVEQAHAYAIEAMTHLEATLERSDPVELSKD